MALRLEINGTDFTAKWRPYASHWTRRAYMGEAAGESEFVIDDADGTINHADLATYKVLRVIEDASGADYEMFKGRITTKTLGRGPYRTGVGMQWTVTAVDANYELRGIRVTDSHRPEESDRERFLAFRFGYLNGSASTNSHARDTTEIDGAFVENADLVTLPAEDYRDTFPDEVFRRICEISGKTFFVFTDGDGTDHLYYALPDDTQLVADISLTDAGTADDVDSYAPNIVATTGVHDGLQVITGGGVRYGDDEFYEASDVAGGEADHDKFEEHFTDEYLVNTGSATAFINNTVASRSNEDFTFTLTWRMRAEHAHRMMAGYITSIRVASANVPAAIDQRATQVSHTPLYPDENGDSWYEITADFGLPRGRPFQRHIRRKPNVTPKPAKPDVDAEVGITFLGCGNQSGEILTQDNIAELDPRPGDLFLVHVSTDANSTIPSTPSGMTAIGAGGSGVNVAERGFYRIIDGSEIGGISFDFVSGRSIIYHAYRGIDQADPIGAIQGTGSGSTTMSWPALTGGSAMEVTDGTSWVVAFGHHKSDATVGTDTLTANDVTNRCHNVGTGGERTTGEHGSWDTNGGVAAWAAHTLTVSNDQWETNVYEIRADQAGAGGETHDGPADEVGTPNGKFANADHHHEDMILFQFTMDNGASVLSTGLKFWTSPIPFIGTITAAYIDADVDGACVIDVGKGATWTGSHFSSICGGNKPTITATGGTDLTFTDTTLTGWTKDFAVNTRFSVNLDSVTGFKKLTFGLRVRKLV